MEPVVTVERKMCREHRNGVYLLECSLEQHSSWVSELQTPESFFGSKPRRRRESSLSVDLAGCLLLHDRFDHGSDIYRLARRDSCENLRWEKIVDCCEGRDSTRLIPFIRAESVGKNPRFAVFHGSLATTSAARHGSAGVGCNSPASANRNATTVEVTRCQFETSRYSVIIANNYVDFGTRQSYSQLEIY